MTDRELAEALVEAGILEASGSSLIDTRYFFPGFMDSLSSNGAVRDWRVAGACLERMPSGWFMTLTGMTGRMEAEKMLRDPRAICEAFVRTQK